LTKKPKTARNTEKDREFDEEYSKKDGQTETKETNNRKQ
jgi:hypothetical protein